MGSTRYVLVLDHEGGALDGSELIESAGKLVRIISVVGTHLEARTSVSKAMLDMAVEFMANKATMPTSQSD